LGWPTRSPAGSERRRDKLPSKPWRRPQSGGDGTLVSAAPHHHAHQAEAHDHQRPTFRLGDAGHQKAAAGKAVGQSAEIGIVRGAAIIIDDQAIEAGDVGDGAAGNLRSQQIGQIKRIARAREVQEVSAVEVQFAPLEILGDIGMTAEIDTGQRKRGMAMTLC